MKFRTRLFLLYFISILLMTLVLAAYFINYEERRIRGSLHTELLVQAKLIGDNFNGTGRLGSSSELNREIRGFAAQTGARITLISQDGTVLGDSAEDYRRMGNHRSRPEIKLALTGREGFSTRYSKTLREPLIYVAYPIRSTGGVTAAIRVAKSQAELNRSLLRMRLLIIGGILFTAVLAVLTEVFLMGQATKPILELQRVAANIARGDLTGRVRFH